jgi:deoxyxylulose-5-phosphate synthase
MSRYLEMVDSPMHVKKLTLEQLQQLAGEIWHELISVLANNGGHVGPNLGVVELTLALHRVFNTPKDKFLWDVSHQIYVHKLLTGRKGRLHNSLHRRAEWLPALGKRARLLWRGACRHRSVRRPGHLRGSRPARQR